MKLNKKKIFKIIGFVIIANYLTAQSPSFKTYTNPVIPGDHPDATLTRIGNYYYTTGSSFNITPVIYRSTDLVHWEAIAQPVKASWPEYGDTPGGGCWGGQVVYHHNKYWHFFSRANTMYYTTADTPEGAWSDPVKIKNPVQLTYELGYDNSVFIDDDGKWYLVVKNGRPNNGIVELNEHGQPTGVVFDLNWLNPPPSHIYSWAEGPVMWKYNGYYYYSFARDLSGGQKVMRSKKLSAAKADWEMLGDFFNINDPLKPDSRFTEPNHSSAVVMLDDSTHWVIHPLYAKGEWKGQGRQGLLNQVFYDVHGKPSGMYPVNTYFTAPKLQSNGIPWMVPKSDFFNNKQLNPEWSFMGYTPDNKYSLTERSGWLRLSPKSNNNINTVTKNDGEHNYSLITRMEFNATSTNDEAGLIILRGDEKMFVKLGCTKNEKGQPIIRFSFNDKKYEAINETDIIWLKIIRNNHIINGFYSSNGTDWIKIGESFNISEIDSYADFVSFTGTRQGLFVKGSNNAYFDLYIYRDAYSPILAECPANQYGTASAFYNQEINVLDSIHNNDWVLYAGVEFGNSEYSKTPKTIEINASCINNGGIVEVWLDSIDTGIKIAECRIAGTCNLNDFETFTAPVAPVQDRHDLYLRFKGNDKELLFKLKWIAFSPASDNKENLIGNAAVVSPNNPYENNTKMIIE